MTSLGDYKGSGAITREQFLFYETRIVARLLVDDNLSDEEIISRIVEDNLFQFPTEKSLKRTVTGCLRRLRCLGDDELIKTVAHSPMEVGKQVCLYAMMKQYRLVWDFMITVIGAKKVLLPQTSAVNLGTVPAELMSSFSLVFYQSAEDAVFKALGVE